MLKSDQVLEISQINDVGERSRRILKEIQPFLNEVMNEFIRQNVAEHRDLENLKVHTYEGSLKRTVSNAQNPNYKDKMENYGNRAFVELQNDQYFFEPYNELLLSLFNLELDLKVKEFRINLTSQFYQFALGLTHHEGAFLSMIKSLDERDSEENLKIWLYGDEIEEIEHHDLRETIRKYEQKKRTPFLYFGKHLPLEGTFTKDGLVKTLGEVYRQLGPVRSFVKEQTRQHASTVRVFEVFKDDDQPEAITVFDHGYEVKMSEAVKVKTNLFKQLFTLYDRDQLITDGHFLFIHYDGQGREALGVFINNRGYMFAQTHFLTQTNKVDWYYKKSFHLRGKPKENQRLQDKVNEALRAHGFTFNDNDSFFLGTYDNDTQRFSESITDVKKRLITAALIFADAREHFTLPKGNDASHLAEEDDEEIFEGLTSSFDLQDIIAQIADSRFTFSKQIIRDFHLDLTSLEDKHFVILNGISGTGKTQLTRLYANAVYGLDDEVENPYLKIIPVRPDWMDSTALFGYYSAFEKRYMMTPFLEMLLQANNEKDKPHFIVLDEMNLARVEYYLSDYLSAVESKQPVHLHLEEGIKEIPREIQIPHNVYLIGTVNVDESTHAISDKVLDRAFVMTLSHVDTGRYWDQLDKSYRELLQKEWSLIMEIHGKLAKYDLHFGYRTLKEMLQKLYKNRRLPEEVRMQAEIAIDKVISEKVLPKLRGDERIASLMEDLTEWAENRLGEHSVTSKHLNRMRKELEQYGATQFWR